MARKEFSGGGRLWLNGTLIADATTISYTRGGGSTRIVTTGGNTGEVKQDPTMAKISVQHAVPKTGNVIRDLSRLLQRAADATWKVQVGNNTRVVVGKITSEKLDTAPGKGDFSFEIEGDVQDV